MAYGKNTLGVAASAYLRSAAHQPVHWMAWGDAAFRRAAELDRPVLLDIGAVWCHWCHVMDRESYESLETAALINEEYVAIKVDRDERPDVDARYQAAVAAMSGQGGWPLTAVLTPDGRPFFAGTYFPPDERYGRPSLRRVLQTMATAYKERRAEVLESAASVMQAIEESESFNASGADAGAEVAERIAAASVKLFDARNGGFGGQPKFPQAAAVDLLLDVAGQSANKELAAKAREAAVVTLRKMARGGVHDQLGGGFHRYSVDERWVVPHFEKMAYDNSALLQNYVHAWQATGDEEFAQVARGIVGWMDECLTDRERGGFYASQDADISLEDDGDYFTWTLAEAREVLAAEELAVAAAYYDIGEVGEMHHDPARNVLHCPAELEDVAAKLGMSATRAAELLADAREKMMAARRGRMAPFVDRTAYTAWNGMCISAYLAAGRALGMREAREFALRSVDRLLAEAWDTERGLAHVVAYADGQSSERVAGMLDDYAFAATACVDAWEASGERRNYDAAMAIAEAMVARFWDEGGAGFYDTERTSEGEQRLGALTARRKPMQDTPTPAGNSVAASLLLRLSELSGREEWGVKARATLRNFSGVMEQFGLYAGSYGLAAQRAGRAAMTICVVGDDAVADEMEKAAFTGYAAQRSVVRVRTGQLRALPPTLAETVPHVPGVADGRSCAVVCSGMTCRLETETEGLKRHLAIFD